LLLTESKRMLNILGQYSVELKVGLGVSTEIQTYLDSNNSSLSNKMGWVQQKTYSALYTANIVCVV